MYSRYYVSTKHDIVWSGDNVSADKEIMASIYRKVFDKKLFHIGLGRENGDYDIGFNTFKRFMKSNDFSEFTEDEIDALKSIYKIVKRRRRHYKTGWFQIEFF